MSQPQLPIFCACNGTGYIIYAKDGKPAMGVRPCECRERAA